MTGTRIVDVCIVGAGPVGGTLACRLGEAGIRTAIIDRAALPPILRQQQQAADILAVLLGRQPGAQAPPVVRLDALTLPTRLPGPVPAAQAVCHALRWHCVARGASIPSTGAVLVCWAL